MGWMSSDGPAFLLPSLQTTHPPRTPSQCFDSLARDELMDTPWDVYGDFDKTSSYLRDFEQEVAMELGMEDAVCMPSGVMAQSIALLIHENDCPESRFVFACHPTSHLLLHEEEGYQHLLNMEAMVLESSLTTTGDMRTDKEKLTDPPLLYDDVARTFLQQESRLPSTLMLELPHREIGGQLTPWNDVLQMQALCQQDKIRFHCDGARLFEAAAGYNRTLRELAEPFDSVYVSLYKGLGGLAGGMLLGSREFCQKARIWLRRFGGNLYTLLPYASAGRQGYRRYWANATAPILSFTEKKEKMIAIVHALQTDPLVSQVVTFHPSTPQTNMVHGYLTYETDACFRALEAAAIATEDNHYVPVFHRCRSLDPVAEKGAYDRGYRTKFEWTLGQANGIVPLDLILRSWQQFGRQLAGTE